MIFAKIRKNVNEYFEIKFFRIFFHLLGRNV